MTNQQEKAYLLVTSGKRKEKLLCAGVPSTLHDEESPEYDVDVPGVIFIGKTCTGSMKAGARFVVQLIDQSISAALIGFSALHNTYKNSFRDPDLKNLLRDRFTYYRWLVFTNITASAVANWEPRDLSWFRGALSKRLDNSLRVGVCTEHAFTDKHVEYLFGDLAPQIEKFKRIKLGE